MLSINGQARLTSLIYILTLILILVFTVYLYKIPPYFPLLLLISFGLFLVALFKTDFALVILILSMLLSPEFSGLGVIPGRSVVVRVDDVFILIIFFGWLARVAINKELGMLRTTVLNRPIILYIIVAIVASLLGALEGNVKIQQSVFYLLKYIEYFLIYFMVVNHLRSVKQVKLFVAFLLLTCFVVCIYAWLRMGSVERVSAPFEGAAGEANTLAGYLLLMMSITLGLFLYTSSLNRQLVLIGLVAFITPPFLFTLSRGTWIAFFPMSMTMAVLTKRRKGLVLLGLLSLFFLMPVLFPQRVRDRVIQTFTPNVPGSREYAVLGKKFFLDQSTVSRVESWDYALKKWVKRPILGYGVPAGIVTDNQYTRVIREMGTVGFAVFIWLLVRIFKAGKQSYYLTTGQDFAQGLCLGFLAGFIGLLFQAFSVETFIIIRIMEPFWFLAAIVMMLPEIIVSSQASSNQPIVAERLNA